MSDLDFFHFKQLKNEVQSQYLLRHTPSFDDISKWKGIDIVYFQEDLRKIAKGNISERSFYTYFKSDHLTKLPRIDMLNLLSVYIGYTSWYDFKKNNLVEGEILEPEEEIETDNLDFSPSDKNDKDIDSSFSTSVVAESLIEANSVVEIPILQNNTTEKQSVSQNLATSIFSSFFGNNIKWTPIFIVLLLLVSGIIAYISLFSEKTYSFCFIDADRNQKIISPIDIKVIKQNESPLFFRINPGECFHYPTKDPILKMEISSSVYENLEIQRNLENANDEETIVLKPDDYKMAVLYFTKKESGNSSELMVVKKQLENRIRKDAVISQIYDNEIFGVEILDRQKYITLVTTPSTSLKNLNVIEMKKDAHGKITSIKFKINENDNK